jgi:phosphopantothenate synthetase
MLPAIDAALIASTGAAADCRGNRRDLGLCQRVSTFAENASRAALPQLECGKAPACRQDQLLLTAIPQCSELAL